MSLLDDVLDKIDEYLQAREDVRDGTDGPRPNEAMQLLSDLRYVRAYPRGVVEPEAASTVDQKFVMLAPDRQDLGVGRRRIEMHRRSVATSAASLGGMMISPAIWTCFRCYATKRTMMDTEATAVDTPSCCGKPMWLTGVPRNERDAAEDKG